jgi:hypothetical protein
MTCCAVQHTTKWDLETDRLVYELYLPAPRLRQAGGLTEEEIRIVEGGNT